MKKFIIGGFAFFGLVIFIVIASLFTGFKVIGDKKGEAEVSLLWGLINLKEKELTKTIKPNIKDEVKVEVEIN